MVTDNCGTATALPFSTNATTRFRDDRYACVLTEKNAFLFYPIAVLLPRGRGARGGVGADEKEDEA